MPDDIDNRKQDGSASNEALANLVRRAQAGDSEACNLLFEQYLEPVLRRVRGRMPPALRDHMESVDIVQTGVREALRSMEDFEWRGGGSFYRWLCRVVEYKMYDRLRYWTATKRDTRKEVPLSPPPDRSDVTASPSPYASTRDDPQSQLSSLERLRVIREHIAKLGGRRAEVLELVMLGLTDPEIGERLSLSADAVRRLRVSAVRSLSFRVKDLFDEPRP